MRTPRVSLLRHADLAALRRVLAPLGGMEHFVQPGATVLLKPNLVFGRAPEKAINTHPSVARAAALLAKEAGAGKILLGDSPGYGSARAAMKACGLAAVAEETGAAMIEFTPAEHVDENRAFVRLELAEEVLGADVVINLPKMKTHGQMLMSLAVKNMFGAVPGARKFQWHYRAGRDRALFARVLNEVAEAVQPQLSILDAVVGMDGMGPSAGRARDVGFLAASDNPWSLDAVVMDVLGIDRMELFTHAEKLGRSSGGADVWAGPEVFGGEAGSFRPDDWRVPELVTLQMHGRVVERYFPRVARWIRRRVTALPVANSSCTGCGYCVRICPAGAIRVEGGRAVVSDAECIRCYCCHELCQTQGLHLRRGGVFARLAGLRR